MKRIIFFGTSNLAATILEGLLQKSSSFEVVAVVTQPDKPAGRKQQVQQSPVAVLAANKGLKILQPLSLRAIEVEKELRELAPDMFIVAAYGKIIPKNILDLAPGQALNVHGSLLPKYRGASPIQAALLNGDKSTGITIMLMDEFLDHGPILSQESLDIDPNDTYPDLELKMANLGQILLLKALAEYSSGALLSKHQDHSQATEVKVIDKAEGKVQWQRTVQEIYNKYRAYYSWPGIWTTWNGQILKIIKCAPFENSVLDVQTFSQDLKVGTVQAEGKNVFVVCGSGLLVLKEVQLEGRKKTSIESFLAGHSDFVGSILF